MANWIKSAIREPGSFSKSAERAGESTAKFAQEKKSAPGVTGKRARLAITLGKLRPKSSGGPK
jgi:hypothetical protein